MLPVLCVAVLTVFADNPYCTASADDLLRRFEERVMTMASWWTAKERMREEARMFFECWVSRRDR